MPHGWVLVGGQAVYLHAIERGAPFVRPTKDADMALDIRAYPTMLHDFTALLVKLDFESAGNPMRDTSIAGSVEMQSWTSSSHGSWANGQTTAAESPEGPCAASPISRRSGVTLPTCWAIWPTIPTK